MPKFTNRLLDGLDADDPAFGAVVLELHASGDLRKLRPRHRKHFRGRVQLHRAGAERNHRRVEADVLALEVADVAHHLRFGVMRVEDWVCKEGRFATQLRRDHRLDALLERVGLGPRGGEKARNLSYGEQRRVEIARALAARPRVLLLDEPTAGMNPIEVQAVAAVIRQVAADGHAVLLVEHNVRLVMDICDHLTVLNFGRVIADGAPAAVLKEPDVVAAYLGSSVT